MLRRHLRWALVAVGYLGMNEKKRRHREKSELRNHCVSVRLNKDELSELDLRRGEYKRGEYLRTVFVDSEPLVIPEINTVAWVELSRSASNLNQLSHQLNMLGVKTSDVSEIQTLLADFRAKLLGVNFLNSGVDDERNAEN